MYEHELQAAVSIQQGQNTSWDACQWTRSLSYTPEALAFSPDGKRLATAHAGTSAVMIWNVDLGSHLFSLTMCLWPSLPMGIT